MKLIYFITCLAIAWSCSPKQDQDQTTTDSEKISSAKKLELRLAGSLYFRRTFAGVHNLEDEEEQNEYVAKQEKSNPVLSAGTSYDKNLLARLEEPGIVKGEELLVHQFKYDTLTSFQITDSIGNKINIQIDFIPQGLGDKIYTSSSKDSSEINIKIMGMERLKYALLDIIPGGNKEIVILDEYYIMMGFNFDLLICEIKS